MQNKVKLILEIIDGKNKAHSIKLRNNLSDSSHDYWVQGNLFFKKYEHYLKDINLTLDHGVDFYLKMIDDMIEERFRFIQSGKYSSSSFEEVEKSVYAKSEVMTYHMHGLVLAQFLWFDQYDRFKFFFDNIIKYFQNGNKYLEIGGGHGLYILSAITKLPKTTQFDLVDISESSLEIAKGIINSDKVNIFNKNIYDFKNEDLYDFITIGEVLEHVEQPDKLLGKIRNHLSDNGICYITTPINAPMIDHIYLFNNEDEIRKLFHKTGFEILEEKIVVSEKISRKKADKFKVPIMYAAFIKKKI